MPSISKAEYKRLVALSRGMRSNRKGKKPAKRKNPRKKAPGKTKAHPAVVAYGLASLQPWSAPPTGLPIAPALPSQKLRCFAKGTMVAGTTGCGFVTSSPIWASDRNCVYYTDGSYTGSTVQITGTGVIGASVNSPYPETDYGPGPTQLRSRIVAQGIRVRYTGTTLNMGGRTAALEEPSHQNLVGASYADLSSHRTVKKGIVSREWTSVTWQHVRPDESQYLTAGWTRTEAALPVPDMAIMVETQAGNFFEYEMFVLFEATGRNLNAVETRSHISTLQHGNVLAATQQLSPTASHALEGAPPPRVKAAIAKAATSPSPLVSLERDASNVGTALGPAATDAAKMAPLLALL